MFTQVEENYLKSLINTYAKNGYIFYLCHTVNEIDNNYDVYVYFSKEEIKAISSTEFELKNAIFIRLDSSSRNDGNYGYSVHSRDLIYNNNLTDTISINQAEFIYTNANYTYIETSSPVNPDLLLQNTNSWFDFKSSAISIVLLVIIFLYLFFTSILRVRR